MLGDRTQAPSGEGSVLRLMKVFQDAGVRRVSYSQLREGIQKALFADLKDAINLTTNPVERRFLTEQRNRVTESDL